MISLAAQIYGKVSLWIPRAGLHRFARSSFALAGVIGSAVYDIIDHKCVPREPWPIYYIVVLYVSIFYGFDTCHWPVNSHSIDFPKLDNPQCHLSLIVLLAELCHFASWVGWFCQMAIARQLPKGLGRTWQNCHKLKWLHCTYFYWVWDQF